MRAMSVFISFVLLLCILVLVYLLIEISGIKKEVAVKPDGVDFQIHDLRLGTTIEDGKILCHVDGIKRDCSVNE
jgi:hypothetical protein